MKIRESGMPDRHLWDSFFNPNDILTKLGLTKTIQNVAEFGCGYGTFTIPASQLIQGQIFAFDIDPEMIKITTESATQQGCTTIQPILRDILAEGTGLPENSIDYVMLFNILHLENPENIINEAKRILKNNGKIAVIHWNYDASTPRGPSLAIRPKPEDCIAWITNSGFKLEKSHDLKPYHYGLVFSKL
jgi:ubiquinone/menaquinone biosynthesis C-methylase UbiE